MSLWELMLLSKLFETICFSSISACPGLVSGPPITKVRWYITLSLMISCKIAIWCLGNSKNFNRNLDHYIKIYRVRSSIFVDLFLVIGHRYLKLVAIRMWNRSAGGRFNVPLWVDLAGFDCFSIFLLSFHLFEQPCYCSVSFVYCLCKVQFCWWQWNDFINWPLVSFMWFIIHCTLSWKLWMV